MAFLSVDNLKLYVDNLIMFANIRDVQYAYYHCNIVGIGSVYYLIHQWKLLNRFARTKYLFIYIIPT